ncbi:MAG TPA: cytochrome P450 [Acidobacteriaceae bacterium]|nr:cytochrome P450 [Acidobacteriaceae bacterium]
MATQPQSATSAQNESGHEPESFRFPPGLQRNLPLYLFRRFFRPGNPILLFEHLAKTYGSVSHYKLGGSNIVFINDPDLIREILVTQASSFIKERTQNRMKILLGEGLITSEGEFHMRQRRIAAPAFHRQRIQAYAGMMVERAAAMRANWLSGQAFDMSAAMMELTLEIVARTLFATDVTAAIREINDEVNVIMRLYNYLIALPRAESYLRWPIPGLIRFRKARAKLDSQVYRMIAERRSTNEDRGDLLSMLMAARDESETPADAGGKPSAPQTGMSDRQLRDEVITIFLAGYETVANALTWTWYLLSENPADAERMRNEIDETLQGRLPTLEDVPRLRYTEMVFAESMRLYPPAWAMGRQSTQIVELGPYRLPAGTYFFFSQYILQRSEQFYPDPLRFDPERFTSDKKAVRPRFTYFPFGGGSRQCIGEAFAWMEGVLILATLAQRWSFRMIPGQTVDVQPKITLRPKFPMMMVAKERSPNSATLEM